MFRNLFVLSLIALLVILEPFTFAYSANWEVAVIFLGSEEPDSFQKDIDQNILELARTSPNSKFKLSILRDFSHDAIEYVLNQDTIQSLTSWDSLFYAPPVAGVQIPGTISKYLKSNNSKSFLDQSDYLKIFLHKAFSIINSKRLLVIYGHGEAYSGLRQKKLIELQSVFQNYLPSRTNRKPLDILYFDSCFMGSIEAIYQFRNTADFMITSQDAEFSAGSPFDVFSDFEDGPEDVKSAALNLAERFVESYSFTKEGSQRNSIEKSSATINVIDTSKLEPLVQKLKVFSTSFSDKQIFKTARNFSTKIAMDKPELVDLGQLVKKLSQLSNLKNISKEIINLLELNQAGRLQTNPRLKIQPESSDSVLTFGYNNWTRGHKEDEFLLSLLPKNLNPTSFITGADSKLWPARKIKKRIYISPFIPGIQIFNYSILDGITQKTLLFSQNFKRTKDYYSFRSTEVSNPILFSAYTQSIGSQAEKYTGLNISDPSIGIPTLDYLQNDFYKETHWSNTMR